MPSRSDLRRELAFLEEEHRKAERASKIREEKIDRLRLRLKLPRVIQRPHQDWTLSQVRSLLKLVGPYVERRVRFRALPAVVFRRLCLHKQLSFRSANAIETKMSKLITSYRLSRREGALYRGLPKSISYRNWTPAMKEDAVNMAAFGVNMKEIARRIGSVLEAVTAFFNETSSSERECFLRGGFEVKDAKRQ